MINALLVYNDIKIHISLYVYPGKSLAWFFQIRLVCGFIWIPCRWGHEVLSSKIKETSLKSTRQCLTCSAAPLEVQSNFCSCVCFPAHRLTINSFYFFIYFFKTTVQQTSCLCYLWIYLLHVCHGCTITNQIYSKITSSHSK